MQLFDGGGTGGKILSFKIHITGSKTCPFSQRLQSEHLFHGGGRLNPSAESWVSMGKCPPGNQISQDDLQVCSKKPTGNTEANHYRNYTEVPSFGKQLNYDD